MKFKYLLMAVLLGVFANSAFAVDKVMTGVVTGLYVFEFEVYVVGTNGIQCYSNGPTGDASSMVMQVTIESIPLLEKSLATGTPVNVACTLDEPGATAGIFALGHSIIAW